MSKTKTGTERKGVREPPYFEIPVWHYIWPLLCMLIAIGNNILQYLVDFTDTEIEHIPAPELRLHAKIKELEVKLEEHWRNSFLQQW